MTQIPEPEDRSSRQEQQAGTDFRLLIANWLSGRQFNSTAQSLSLSLHELSFYSKTPHRCNVGQIGSHSNRQLTIANQQLLLLLPAAPWFLSFFVCVISVIGGCVAALPKELEVDPDYSFDTHIEIKKREGSMLAIRLYVAGLTILFLLLVLATRTVGILEACVIVCPLLYLILDLREELVELRQLEARVSLLSQ